MSTNQLTENRSTQQWTYPASFVYVCTTCEPKSCQPTSGKRCATCGNECIRWGETAQTGMDDCSTWHPICDSDTEKCTPAMWSSYHAAPSDTVGHQILLDNRKKGIEALLPLFHEKAATPEMIRHGMELVKKTTEHLNPHQVPVLVVDQPLYDLTKIMQWTFHDIFGEDKFVVMLGGLHIEMALWSTMGDLLRGSGWPETLKKDSGTEMALEDWVVVASQQSPTFKFWLLVHKYQHIIFMFIRAHRERKLELMVTTLRKLVPLFFALDHQNYARWIPIFIRDLEVLPDSIQVEFEKGHWTITRSNRRFSSLPVDQAHEKANKRVKGVGGIIGLTENHDMLERWIMTGRKSAVSLRSLLVQTITMMMKNSLIMRPQKSGSPSKRERHQTDLSEHYRHKPGHDNVQSHGPLPRIHWIRQYFFLQVQG